MGGIARASSMTFPSTKSHAPQLALHGDLRGCHVADFVPFAREQQHEIAEHYRGLMKIPGQDMPTADIVADAISVVDEPGYPELQLLKPFLRDCVRRRGGHYQRPGGLRWPGLPGGWLSARCG